MPPPSGRSSSIRRAITLRISRPNARMIRAIQSIPSRISRPNPANTSVSAAGISRATTSATTSRNIAEANPGSRQSGSLRRQLERPLRGAAYQVGVAEQQQHAHVVQHHDDQGGLHDARLLGFRPDRHVEGGQPHQDSSGRGGQVGQLADRGGAVHVAPAVVEPLVVLGRALGRRNLRTLRMQQLDIAQHPHAGHPGQGQDHDQHQRRQVQQPGDDAQGAVAGIRRRPKEGRDAYQQQNGDDQRRPVLPAIATGGVPPAVGRDDHRDHEHERHDHQERVGAVRADRDRLHPQRQPRAEQAEAEGGDGAEDGPAKRPFGRLARHARAPCR